MNDYVVTISYGWILAWAILILTAFHLRAKRRDRHLEMQHKERLTAMEKGVPVPELNSSVYHDRPNPRWPLGLGGLLVMVGTGSVTALIVSPEEAFHRMWSIGLIWVFAGFGFVLYYFLTRERGR